MLLKVRTIFLTILSVLLSAASLWAQEQSDSLVRLDYGKTAELVVINGQNYRKVIGPAQFMHNNTYMLCDTALWNTDTHVIDAIGHVSIIQEGTVLTSDKFVYYIDEDLAQFRGSVVQLEDSDHNVLRTSYLDYNTRDSVGVFKYGGSMRDQDGQIIESVDGTYDGKISLFTFTNDVNMFTDSVFVKTTHLEYESDRDFATFGRETDAWQEDNMLSSNAGWYDRNRGVFFFRDNVHFMTDTQEGWSDSLYYYRGSLTVDMMGRAQVTDTSRNTSAVAGRMIYVDSLSRVTMLRDPAIIGEVSQGETPDSLFFGADTIIYRKIRMCDLPEDFAEMSSKRLADLYVDPVGTYRKKAAEAAAQAAEEAYKDDPNYRGAQGAQGGQQGDPGAQGGPPDEEGDGSGVPGGLPDEEGDGSGVPGGPPDEGGDGPGVPGGLPDEEGDGPGDDDAAVAGNAAVAGDSAVAAESVEKVFSIDSLYQEAFSCGFDLDSLINVANEIGCGIEIYARTADYVGCRIDSLTYVADSLGVAVEELIDAAMSGESAEGATLGTGATLRPGAAAGNSAADGRAPGHKPDDRRGLRPSDGEAGVVGDAGEDGMSPLPDSLGYARDSLGFARDSLGFGKDSLGFGKDSLGYAQDSLALQDSLANVEPLDTTEIGFLWAIGKVKLYKEDMQIICDSLEYCDLDSLARLYKDPLIWNGITQQYSADSVTAVIRNSTLERASLMSNAFVSIEEEQGRYYNQIRSTETLAYFDSEGELSRFDALGTADCLFFLREDEEVATVNKTNSKMMYGTFANGNIQRVYYFDTAQSDAYPVVQLPKDEQTFKGFTWQPERRPEDRYAVTTAKLRSPEREKYAARPRSEFIQTNTYFPGYIPGIYMEIEQRDSLQKIRAQERQLAEAEQERLAEVALADSLERRDSIALADSLATVQSLAVADSLARIDSLASAAAQVVADSIARVEAKAYADSVAAAEAARVWTKEELKEAAKEAKAQEREARKAAKAAARQARKDAREQKWAEKDQRDIDKAEAKAEAKAAKLREKKRKYLLKSDAEEADDAERLRNAIEKLEAKDAAAAERRRSKSEAQDAAADAEEAAASAGAEEDLAVGSTEEDSATGTEVDSAAASAEEAAAFVGGTEEDSVTGTEDAAATIDTPISVTDDSSTSTVDEEDSAATGTEEDSAALLDNE